MKSLLLSNHKQNHSSQTKQPLNSHKQHDHEQQNQLKKSREFLLAFDPKFADKPSENPKQTTINQSQSFKTIHSFFYLSLSLFSPSKAIIVGFFNPFPLPLESIPFLFSSFSSPISFSSHFGAPLLLFVRFLNPFAYLSSAFSLFTGFPQLGIFVFCFLC